MSQDQMLSSVQEDGLCAMSPWCYQVAELLGSIQASGR